jgi:hypothetical protein
MNDTRTTLVVPDLSMIQSLPSRSSVVAGPLPCVDSAYQSRELPQMRCVVRVSEMNGALLVQCHCAWRAGAAASRQRSRACTTKEFSTNYMQQAIGFKTTASWRFACNEPPTASSAAAWAREATNVDGERDIVPLFLSGQSIDQVMTRAVKDAKRGMGRCWALWLCRASRARWGRTRRAKGTPLWR